MELRAEGIEKRYYRHWGEANWFYAVCPTECTLREGVLTVLMGRSGSGKTTFVQMLGGLLSPSAGNVLAGGKNLYGLSDGELSRFRNAHIAMIPQGHSGVGSLTVLENILLPCALHTRQKPDEKEAEALLDRLGMLKLAGVYPAELSGGELRRMAVVRALMQKTEILLADEPTGDLDDENSLLVMSLLKEYARKGKAVLLVTHENTASEFADVIWHMNAGTMSEK